MKELIQRVWKKEEGFSLIELIIVIAILAIIAAIAVPNLLGNIQKANIATDESNAKLIADAIATAVASNPSLEGIDVPSGTSFVAPSGTVQDWHPIMTSAIATLNGDVPTLKSNKYGTVNAQFKVGLTTGGVITVTGDVAVASSSGPRQIFPVPNPAP